MRVDEINEIELWRNDNKMGTGAEGQAWFGGASWTTFGGNFCIEAAYLTDGDWGLGCWLAICGGKTTVWDTNLGTFGCQNWEIITIETQITDNHLIAQHKTLATVTNTH